MPQILRTFDFSLGPVCTSLILTLTFISLVLFPPRNVFVCLLCFVVISKVIDLNYSIYLLSLIVKIPLSYLSLAIRELKSKPLS